MPALRALLEGGMPVDPPEGFDSAFHEAVKWRRFEAAQVLLDAGGRVDHRGAGFTPLGAACQSHALPTIGFLLKAGASLTAQDDLLGWTLQGGMPSERAAVLALLVRNGLDPNTVVRGRITVLMAVCEHGDIETARLLLDRGADPNTRLEGSALTVAEENGHQALVDLLLERGAKPERPDVAPDEARDVCLAAALQRPQDVRRRLAWAEMLARLGKRAAAASEVQAASQLGAQIPDALREALTFENPPGTRWHFTGFEPPFPGVAGVVDDPRFPGARVTTGTQTLPLAVVLGPACTRCDEQGEVVCGECNGTGRGDNYLTGGSFVCEPRMDCNSCRGLKYDVRSVRFGKGTCLHEVAVPEMTMGKVTLSRCTTCGLACLGPPTYREYACGVCGYFVCRCVGSAPNR